MNDELLEQDEPAGAIAEANSQASARNADPTSPAIEVEPPSNAIPFNIHVGHLALVVPLVGLVGLAAASSDDRALATYGARVPVFAVLGLVLLAIAVRRRVANGLACTSLLALSAISALVLSMANLAVVRADAGLNIPKSQVDEGIVALPNAWTTAVAWTWGAAFALMVLSAAFTMVARRRGLLATAPSLIGSWAFLLVMFPNALLAGIGFAIIFPFLRSAPRLRT